MPTGEQAGTDGTPPKALNLVLEEWFAMVRNNNNESGLRYRVYSCVRAGRMWYLRGVYELGLVTALLLACSVRTKGDKFIQVVASWRSCILQCIFCLWLV